MNDIKVSRKWKPGEPMSVRWSRPALGGSPSKSIQSMHDGCFFGGLLPVPPGAPVFIGFSPAPMLERAYLVEEILVKMGGMR